MIEISRWPLAATVSVAARTSSKLVSTCSDSVVGRLSASTAVVIGPSSSPKLDRRAEVVALLSLVPVTRSPALFKLYELCQHDGRDESGDRSPTGSQLHGRAV